MVIKETSIFTKRVDRLLDRESFRLLQLRLVAEPEAGDVIKGTGGKNERDDLTPKQKAVLKRLIEEEFS